MSGPQGQDVTALLVAVGAGDRQAVDALFPVVYEQLRGLAAQALQRERPDHTLQPTALVHEAYLRLVNQREADWQNRAHFCAVAAQAIRRVLIDHARGHRRQKRGGGKAAVTLSVASPIFEEREVDLLALDEALSRLAEVEPLEARIVEMRFFAELNVEEIAKVLGISDRSVRRHWNYAKAWLYREIRKGDTKLE
ncbi:MAG: sigma-70 family RNA polymerase sigma factor [Candidatus Brocadiae bacterium]|nr:sigma-70 family RNA polymerase sigma factor [Candidatus Brocadiia bacterium]